MEGNKNWAGIAALLLAGLALLVALDGRLGSFGDSGPFNVTAMAVPMAPDAPSFSIAPAAQATAVPFTPDMKPELPGFTYALPDKALRLEQSGTIVVKGISADRGFFDGSIRDLVRRFFDNIPNLLQLIGLAALIVVGLRTFDRRSKARGGPATE